MSWFWFLFQHRDSEISAVRTYIVDSQVCFLLTCLIEMALFCKHSLYWDFKDRCGHRFVSGKAEEIRFHLAWAIKWYLPSSSAVLDLVLPTAWPGATGRQGRSLLWVGWATKSALPQHGLALMLGGSGLAKAVKNSVLAPTFFPSPPRTFPAFPSLLFAATTLLRCLTSLFHPLYCKWYVFSSFLSYTEPSLSYLH